MGADSLLEDGPFFVYLTFLLLLGAFFFISSAHVKRPTCDI
jgi:hypothetical protein